MFTFVTQLGAYAVDYDELCAQFAGITCESAFTPYLQYTEMAAFLRGEKVTLSVIDDLAISLEATCVLPENREGRRIEIECSDGTSIYDLDLETLSRHFTLFRDFFNDYPNADSISIPTIRVRDLKTVLCVLFEQTVVTLTEQILYTINVLNPIHNAFFLLFSLIGTKREVVTSLMNRVTDEEKQNIIDSHILRTYHNSELYTVIRLPPQVAFLAGTYSGSEYLATEEGYSLAGHNGWAFCNAAKHRQIPLMCKLIKSDFTQDKYIPLTGNERSVVCYSVAECISGLSDEKDRSVLILACTMLGIHHESLGNVGKKANSPYLVPLAILPLNTYALHILGGIQKSLAHYGYNELSELPRLGEDPSKNIV
jgi:hypothetical protein